MAKANLYVQLTESISSDYVSVKEMFLENNLQKQYEEAKERWKMLSEEFDVEIKEKSLEEFRREYVLVNVEYDGRKRKISEKDALIALEKEGYIHKIGDGLFGGYFKRTDKLKAEKETFVDRFLVVA